MANRTSERDPSTEPKLSSDPLIAESEQAEIDANRARKAANLFDLRRMIGGLFAIYGVILTILGLGASQEEIDKAAGINLNLWVGLCMLVVAALFITWALMHPMGEELEEAEQEEGDRTVKGAHAPTGPDAAALAGSKTTSRRSRSDGASSGNGRRFGRE